MTIKKNVILSITLAVIVLFVSIPMSGCDSKFVPSEADKDTLQSLPPEFLTISQAWQLLQKYYVDKKQLDPAKLAQGAIRGMVDAVGDNYTEYFSPQVYKSTMIELTGLYQGIG
ncbi:MAG: hypothetical protein PHQ86_09120, partial [Dehalococcoidales bacterium]|nr:hypothetical protein [Dehalococcoidales bacterium]